VVNHGACGGSGSDMLSRSEISDLPVKTEYLDNSDGCTDCIDAILRRFSISSCGRLRALMRDRIALSLLVVVVLSTESFCA